MHVFTYTILIVCWISVNNAFHEKMAINGKRLICLKKISSNQDKQLLHSSVITSCIVYIHAYMIVWNLCDNSSKWWRFWKIHILLANSWGIPHINTLRFTGTILVFYKWFTCISSIKSSYPQIEVNYVPVPDVIHVNVYAGLPSL